MTKANENRLQVAIDYMEGLPDERPFKVNIKGKWYAQVATRIVAFRKAYGDQGRIITKVHESTENRVLMEASIYVNDGKTWQLIGNDWAEEFRNDGPINKKSATENCSTSAIGRALASCGLGGGEYASVDEVEYAITEKQGVSEEPKEKEPPKEKPKEEPKEEPKEQPKEEPKEEVEDEKTEEMFAFTQGMIAMVDMMDSHEALNSYWNDKTNLPKIEVLENNYPKYFNTLKQVFVRKYEEIEQSKATQGEKDA